MARRATQGGIWERGEEEPHSLGWSSQGEGQGWMGWVVKVWGCARDSTGGGRAGSTEMGASP